MTEVEALTVLFHHFFRNVVSDHTSASALTARVQQPILEASRLIAASKAQDALAVAKPDAEVTTQQN
jgi:hypothetical protein